MTDTCAKCGNPLAEDSSECDICGALALGADAPFLTRHPLLRRLQELGIAMLTLILGLALGGAIIIAIQLNHTPASARPVIEGGPLLTTTTPQFAPAIVATSVLTEQQTPAPTLSANPQFAATDLLGRATASMAALHSYQISGSLSEAGQTYNLSAAFAAADKASLTISTAGIPGPQFSAVFSSFTLYTSSDGTNWTKDSNDGPLVRIALAGLWSGFDTHAIAGTAALRLIGHEQINGTATTHLQTDPATIAAAHTLLRTVGVSSYTGTVDIWVSDSDATIQRIRADISDGKVEYKADLTFSNFNGVVTVEEPK
jgi:hypothetical protein